MLLFGQPLSYDATCEVWPQTAETLVKSNSSYSADLLYWSIFDIMSDTFEVLKPCPTSAGIGSCATNVGAAVSYGSGLVRNCKCRLGCRDIADSGA